MDEKLQNLNHSMMETVFKNLKFSERLSNSITTEIKQNDRHKIKSDKRPTLKIPKMN
jgi:hypothetical protein